MCVVKIRKYFYFINFLHIYMLAIACQTAIPNLAKYLSNRMDTQGVKFFKSHGKHLALQLK